MITDVGLYDMTELCARYAVSRKTGYKWLARYDAAAGPRCSDRSRAPHHLPAQDCRAGGAAPAHRAPAAPDWGPEKLLQWLEPRHPGVAWPAISTAGDLLARHGLVKKRRRRRPMQHPGVVPPVTHAPNDLWAADFKGQFRTGDRIYCYPLTVTDQHTRYLLACHGLLSTQGHRRAARLRSPVPRVRAAAGDADRQRRAVRLHLAAWAVVLGPKGNANSVEQPWWLLGKSR